MGCVGSTATQSSPTSRVSDHAIMQGSIGSLGNSFDSTSSSLSLLYSSFSSRRYGATDSDRAQRAQRYLNSCQQEASDQYAVPDLPPQGEERTRQRCFRQLAFPDEGGFELNSLSPLVQLAQMLLSVKTVLVSMVHTDKQHFIARRGLPDPSTGRNVSFCAHVVASHEPLLVHNALADKRFKCNPLVVGPPYIRFYAGFPIFLDDVVLGTMCFIDYKDDDHLRLSPRVKEMEKFTNLASSLISLRRQSLMMEDAQKNNQALLNANLPATVLNKLLSEINREDCKVSPSMHFGAVYPYVGVCRIGITNFGSICSSRTSCLSLNLLSAFFHQCHSAAVQFGVQKARAVGDALILYSAADPANLSWISPSDETKDPEDAQIAPATVAKLVIPLLQAALSVMDTVSSDLTLSSGLSDGSVLGAIVSGQALCFDLYGAAVTSADRLQQRAVRSTVCMTKKLYAAMGKSFSVKQVEQMQEGGESVEIVHVSAGDGGKL